MTIGEIHLHINVYKDKLEKEAEDSKAKIYSTAALISQFTSLSFNGKPIPSFSEVFPTQDNKDEKEELTEEDKLRMALYKEQFLDFANHRNKLFHKEGK